MTSFAIHTIDTAPAAAKPILEATNKGWGFVPNLFGVLAEAPAALAGATQLLELAGQTSFTPAEQQIVFLAVNFDNECTYCMAGHSVMAKNAGVPADVIDALREGRPLADARLEALRQYTSRVVLERGRVGDAAVEAFIAAGFTRQQVLEIVLIVATKVMSNYTNHVAHTPNDAFMANTTWTPPARRALAA